MEPAPSKKFNSLYVVIAALVLLLLGGIFFVIHKNKSGQDASVQGAEVQSSNVKEFTVDGSNFQFTPSTITVNKGDTVKITFKDDDGTHNLALSGYNLTTNTIRGGGEDSIQFVADKRGTFEYFCSVANHRELGMTGQLIVQ